MPTYAASTPPATVAKPPVITAISSERVMSSTNGFTTSGASVCPTKMLAAALSVSAPDVRRVRCMTQATPWTTFCIQPRW